MTCRNKFHIDHVDMDSTDAVNLRRESCPHDFDYAEEPDYCTGNRLEDHCFECWERQIVEKPKEKPMIKTKKTKTELMEEIAELEKQLKDLERYKVLQEGADEIKAIHTAFMNSGFSNEQAFELLKSMLDTMLPAFAKGL